MHFLRHPTGVTCTCYRYFTNSYNNTQAEGTESSCQSARYFCRKFDGNDTVNICYVHPAITEEVNPAELFKPGIIFLRWSGLVVMVSVLGSDSTFH